MRNIARKYLSSKDASKPVLDALRQALGLDLGDFGVQWLCVTLEMGKPVMIEVRGFARGEPMPADEFVEAIQLEGNGCAQKTEAVSFPVVAPVPPGGRQGG